MVRDRRALGLKEEFLDLLKRDIEFRYTVAGLIGLEEILRRLDKIEEEMARLREDFNKMLEVIKGLKLGQRRPGRRLDSIGSAMISGFGELSKFPGMTFEEFVRRFLTAGLRGSGDIPGEAKLKRAAVEGEEINLFLEDP
jgi:hypothetical protein